MTLAQFVKFAGAALAATMAGLTAGTWQMVLVSLLAQGLSLFANSHGIPTPAQGAGPPLPMPPESEWTAEGLMAHAKALAVAPE